MGTRRKRRMAGIAAGVAIGVLYIAVDELFAGPAALVVALVAVCLYVAADIMVYSRRLPALVHAELEKQLDPTAGPPGGATPITLDLADRWVEAVSAHDWPALAGFLSDDLAVTGSPDGRVYSRRRYVMTARRMARVYPDLRVRVDELVASPDTPQVAWVRLTETGTPPRGPALDVSWWERWTLDDAGHLREVHLAGVVRMSSATTPAAPS